MNAKLVSLSAPFISRDASLWFSAYGFGWGYCAFSIPIDAVCEYLGAADASTKQLMLAFELSRNRISKVVKQVEIPETGERIILDRLDQ
ncbi:hypothetical protein [Caballeronia mineralivorans]|jgi:hypothetical protein|uniref:hypothetical protein n=1 Tax=Caballeronia mineralivorans TaxID=2010198 RepID=UPI0023F02E4A|nr:hypothetical protein [Caballeronia mineralivorans]MDB5788269.1 hypothetical protein [Caballeronia mineralivorans]MEA3104783.1 hypothetical protein [Caballeronia mineralivorans]